MKCETPAFASVSSREPAPIQKPIATERTLGTRSEMTRSPVSSSETTYFCTARIIPALPVEPLFDAERVPFRVAERRPALSLDDRGAEADEPLHLGVLIVCREVEMDRV